MSLQQVLIWICILFKSALRGLKITTKVQYTTSFTGTFPLASGEVPGKKVGPHDFTVAILHGGHASLMNQVNAVESQATYFLFKGVGWIREGVNKRSWWGATFWQSCISFRNFAWLQKFPPGMKYVRVLLFFFPYLSIFFLLDVSY